MQGRIKVILRKSKTYFAIFSLFFFTGASCDEVKDKVYYLNVDRGGLERSQDKELKTWKQIKEEKVPYYCVTESTLEYLYNKCSDKGDD